MRPRTLSTRHFVGADSTTTTDQSTYQTAIDQSVSNTAYQPALDVSKDWQLLYPNLWIPWAVNKIIDPSQTADTTVRRKQVASIAKQLNDTLEKCSAIPQNDRDGWKNFTQGFVVWYNHNGKELDPSEYEEDARQADIYQSQLRDWQVEIEKYCPTGMPPIPKPAPTWEELGREFLETAGKYFDTAKVVSLVVLAGFILVVFVIGKDKVARLVMRALPAK
jgi:hypothetical protein